jgi:hypothetical protein
VGPDSQEDESVVDGEGEANPQPTDEATPPQSRPLRPYIRGFVKRAILWSLAFGVIHLLGLRAYTSMLSGTGSVAILERLAGAAYLLLYAGVVFLVPVLLIAAGLLKAVELTFGPSSRTALNHHGEVEEVVNEE